MHIFGKIRIVAMSTIALMTNIKSTGAQEAPKSAKRSVEPYFTSALVLPISPKGTGLPPSAVESFAVAVPVGERFSIIPEAGIATGFTTFQPSPRINLGGSMKLTQRFGLGVTLSYGYIPHWVGTPSDGHLIGGFLAPFVALPNKLLLVFPIGVVDNMTTKVISFPIVFKLAVPLK